MDELKKKEQKQIAELLFKYFIMNDKYIAVQMPDGKYIPSAPSKGVMFSGWKSRLVRC